VSASVSVPTRLILVAARLTALIAEDMSEMANAVPRSPASRDAMALLCPLWLCTAADRRLRREEGETAAVTGADSAADPSASVTRRNSDRS
jgi:hypothetical protein